ncbi:MAG TPA: hypothetical protein VII45_01745 [Solirubrobacterales bacterium]
MVLGGPESATSHGESAVRVAIRRGLSIVAAAMAVTGILLPSGAAASVPANGRAWELVSIPDPVAARVRATAPPDAAGDHVFYATFGPTPGAPSGAFLSFNQAVRGKEGWTTTPVGFPYSQYSNEFVFPQILPASPADGSMPSLWASTVPLIPAGPPEGHLGLYRRDSDNALTLIADIGEANNLFFYGGYIEQSDDGTHVFFNSKEHLLTEDAGRTEGKSIYESYEGGLRLVDVDNGGSLLSSCGSLIAHPDGEHAYSDGENRISASGERVFFTNPGPETSCPGPSEVYLREGADRTVEVSASQCTRLDCDAPQNVSFAGATRDGASVFLTTSQQLTNDDTNSLSDLYRYDVGDEKLTLLTPRPPSATGAVRTVGVHVSNDGSHVYFYVEGQLLPGEGSESQYNLYLVDSTGLHFVAIAGPGGNGFPGENLQLSPDGRTAVFGTSNGIDPSDTDGRPDVYLYHADDQSLTLVSSGSSGGNGEFDASISTPYEWEALVPGRPLLYHAMSDDGKDVFFSTKEQLVPEDVNQVVDVYEWKEGHVGLVSSGTGASDAEFGGATPDGRTVFFRTSDSLVPADHDGGDSDLYAARVGGGFAEAASPAKGCSGPCRPAPPGGAERPVPPSATYRAHGTKGRIRLLKILSGGGANGSGSDATLLAAVPSPGLVSASASRPGNAKAIVAQGSAGAIRSGKLRIPLQLSKAAERLLMQKGSLKVRLLIREGKQRLARTVTLTSGGSR